MVSRAFSLWSIRLVLVTTCLLLATACQSEDEPTAPTSRTVEGNFTHSGTGITFPESIGDFARVEVTEFDDSGDDISVGYNLDTPDLISATVYVYPGRSVLDVGGGSDAVEAARQFLDEEEFEGSKEAILRTTPGLTTISEDDSFVINNPGERAGRRAVFGGQGVIRGERTVLYTEVDLFGEDDWFVKYRFTYPGESPTAEVAILDFMDSLDWPTD